MAESFLTTGTFLGLGAVCTKFPHCADTEIAAWIKQVVEDGMSDKPASRNPKLDAALLLASGIHALGAEVSRLVHLGDHPQEHLPLQGDSAGFALWSLAERYISASSGSGLTCPDIVKMLRPSYQKWLEARDRKVEEEVLHEGSPRSWSGEAMDRSVGAFFRGLESNRPTGILRALIWAGILSLDGRGVPIGRGPTVWFNAALAVACGLGGNRGGSGRRCHPLLDEGFLPGDGPAEERIGLGASVFALTTAKGPATAAKCRNVIPAYGWGHDRADMIYLAAQMLEGFPLPGLNCYLVESGFVAGNELKAAMLGEDSLGAMSPVERQRVNVWGTGMVQRAFTLAVWGYAARGKAGFVAGRQD
jgi:hypothetical protein